jgi:hypothetical protein
MHCEHSHKHGAGGFESVWNVGKKVWNKLKDVNEHLKEKKYA